MPLNVDINLVHQTQPTPLNLQGDLRYAGIGGLAELLGWTEVQQENGSSGFLGGSNNIIRGVRRSVLMCTAVTICMTVHHNIIRGVRWGVPLCTAVIIMYNGAPQHHPWGARADA